MQNKKPFKQPPRKFHPKGLSIVYEDWDILVVDKSCGLLSVGSETVRENTAHYLLNDYVRKGNSKSRNRVFIVHRLDRDTSGILVFAKSEEAKADMIPLFKGRDIMKIYRAITIGSFPKTWNEIRTDIEGFMSTTRVKTLDSNKYTSYLELRIETGRTHQIRRHLADKRYPVLGDKKYAGTGNELSLAQSRQMLHAYRLIFPHPKTQKIIRVLAPLPSDFKKCLSQMKLR